MPGATLVGALPAVPTVLVREGGMPVNSPRPPREGPDLARYPSAPPGRPIRLLFVHHSVGAQWLAPPGPEPDAGCAHPSHPNGGGLRVALEADGYRVHEASYGSRLGERTDLFDWLPKLRENMDELLAYEVVMLKSCFPNSRFVGVGIPPGDAAGPTLTLWNARATLEAVRDVVVRHTGTLFVYVTAPPLVPEAAKPAWRRVAGALRRWCRGEVTAAEGARLARAFNDWLRCPRGWLARYPQRNLVVFDYFDILTDHGASNFLSFATGGGTDAHPSAAGNRRATEAFVPFLNRAVRRAGLVPGRLSSGM